MSKIVSVRGRRVWDSRGRPTVEAEICLENGQTGRAIAPSGASRGTREALELRDGGAHLGGFDVRQACANINGPVAAALTGMDATSQEEIDAALLGLDSSVLKVHIGGNAMVAASLAALHAGAAATAVPVWQHIADLYETTPSLP